ncbi:hypothetical protein BSL78_09466 [Apostichopus japonicus]|uniref:Tyrosine-protein kinase ephrin type A/B receptor-like domain-containing protein n=1 Tax=Stichopus japonicus TaxID=307972 RepID=A0A2G8L009_STIJA|nr:hypothetical protein BSL78_09466 [Apostichopus japonicus]
MIAEIPSGLFNFPNRSYELKILYLHKNRIEFIPEKAFIGLYAIQYIFLYDNSIHTLADRAFEATGVSAVYLFSNNLTYINGNPFSNTNLSEIHLFSNKIQNVSETVIQGLGKTAKMYLSCQFLTEAPWAPKHVTMRCVSPLFVPTLKFPRSTLPYTLRQQGFSCNISKKGISECQPCKPGTFGDGINGCTPCPSGGFYQDEIAQTASYQGGMDCKECNSGTFVNSEGGIAIYECQVCPEGTDQTKSAGFRACFCKENYARIDRFGACELCLEDGLNCTHHDFKALLPGYYWNWSFPSANIHEYQEFAKNLEEESRFYDKRYANYSSDIPKVYKCPRTTSCINNHSYSSTGITGLCDHGYTGWLCSKCQERYFMVLNTCVSCPEQVWMILEVIAVLIIIILFYFIVIQQYKRDRNVQERTIFDTIVSRGKIILGFYQVVGEFFESLHDVSWAGGLQIIGEFISYIELNVLRVIVRPQCFDKRLNFNPKVEFIIGIILPIFIIVMAVGGYCVYKAYVVYKSRALDHPHPIHDNLLKLKTKLTTLVLVLWFVIYPPICTIIFQLLPRACKEFCLDHQNMHCFHLLRSDYEIQCDSLTFYQYAAYVATALYVVSFPCALLYLLRKHRSTKKSKTSLQTCVVETEEENEGLDEETPLLKEPSAHPIVPIWLNFLCENYKPQYWYWEILELTRKVTQTILITLLGWE